MSGLPHLMLQRPSRRQRRKRRRLGLGLALAVLGLLAALGTWYWWG